MVNLGPVFEKGAYGFEFKDRQIAYFLTEERIPKHEYWTNFDVGSIKQKEKQNGKQ